MSGHKDIARGFSQTANPIATKGERDTLIAGRPKPELEYHLRPGGVDAVTVRQVLEMDREDRINKIQNRLDSASRIRNRDRSKAMVRGKAKTDFERSR